jgi:hypothetical protein
MQPRLQLPRVELLGKMILAKSLQQRRKNSYDRVFMKKRVEGGDPKSIREEEVGEA